MPLLDHLAHACLGDQHLVKDEERPVVDTELRWPRQLRLQFGAKEGPYQDRPPLFPFRL